MIANGGDKGARAFVIDLLDNPFGLFGGKLVGAGGGGGFGGGGSYSTPVFCDGTDWYIG